ncbi:MAG TPA: ATP-dependent DNA helicase [bacterium]|nr:ATP-dependent DNA helicase [bacterium]
MSSRRGSRHGPDQLGLGLAEALERDAPPAGPDAVPSAPGDGGASNAPRSGRAVPSADGRGVPEAESAANGAAAAVADLPAPPVPTSEAVLDGLTGQQREAVVHAEGPLLIVAGAGTGKTTVITRRIGHLITSRLVRPEQVLALTFTDRAAAEMEERVDRLVPYGYTQAWISTFHAFGDRVLRDHALHLGLPPDFRVLNRAEQAIFIRERLFEFPLDHFRPLGDPARYVDALIGLISRAKDEDITPEEYAAYADRLAASAAAQPDDSVLADHARQQRELAAAYRVYQDLLAKDGRLDFGDLIVLTIRLLREHPDVLQRYQEQFHHILVDEFQDTNYAQFELVKLLAGARRNLTVVADDDQAIYRFRGASYSNITFFTETYADARTVVLTQNYRSTQFILDAAYRLIRHNDPDRLEVRVGIDKRLEAVAGPGTLPRHLHYESLGAEADGVADRIAERVKAGAWQYRDVALLVRANKDADPFLRALNMRGIPFQFSGTRGLYDREEIRLLTSFLRALAHPEDSLSLYHLSASPLYGVPEADLAACMSYASRKRRPLAHVYRHLARIEDLELSREGHAVIDRLVDDLDEMSRLAPRYPTGRVLYEYLVNRTGFIGRLASSDRPEDEHKVANIAKFFDLVARFGDVASVDRLPAFVAYLDLLIEAGDDPPTADVDGEADVVRVLTIHKAKGLEFPVVFLLSVVTDKFPSRARREPLPLPDALMKDLLPSGDFHVQEERRLCYVGMTRAKRELYLTSASDYGGARPRKASRFVLEALDVPRVPPETVRTTAAQAVERHAPPVEPDVPSLIPLGDDAVLQLSFRQVDDYMTCPYKYRYIHLLRVPVLRDHRVAYGSALHDAVQEYNRRRARHQPVTADDLIAHFERAWVNEGFLSREHEDQRMEAGRDALRRFFEFQQASDTTPTFVEREFRFPVGPNLLRGRWDRVDLRGAEVVIIDFKSTDVRTQQDADRRAKDSEQLSIYALAYLEVFGRLPDRVELHFLGREVIVGQARKTEADIDAVRAMILKAAAGIRAQQFLATPDPYRACPYCAFNQICPFTAAPE